ncbi:MAG: methyltransferase family protein [Boseongicola sp.]
MFWRVAKAVLVLPGTALIYIPLLIHWFSKGWPFGGPIGSTLNLVLAAILAVPSVLLAVSTVRLFAHEGDGTPAPWDPPQKFVVSGPYLYMRNPMLTAAILLIIAEAIALSSVALLGWAVLFFLLNTVYFAFSEEPGLERRFGDSYVQYKASVPRWIPNLQPYEPSKGG